MNRATRRHQERANRNVRPSSDRVSTIRIPSPGRIFWLSNAPWAATGYGQQTAQVTKRLKKENYEIAIGANYGLEGASTIYPTEYGSIPVYPRGFETYSNDIMPAHMHDWRTQNPELPSLLITLFDVWVFRGKKWNDIPIASWVPIDHMPMPPEVREWCAKENVTPIAMSKYGQTMLERAELQSKYIPHGIEKTFRETKKFKTSDGEFITGREFMGIEEDKFVVGMNAANKGVVPNRKAFGENLLAFSMFAQKHPDAVLYLHTECISASGLNLFDLIKAVGIKKEQYRFIDPYLYRTSISQEVMAATYTAMDVLLATSMGEGFGIPTIEAQACGTKVIASDFAASTELVGDGWLIEGQPFWDPMQKSFQHMPSIPAMVDALEQAYQKGRERSQKAVDFAAQYEADFIFETEWKPVLEDLLKA